MKKRFSEEQIVGFLRKAEAGMAVKELRRKHGFGEASYFAPSAPSAYAVSLGNCRGHVERTKTCSAPAPPLSKCAIKHTHATTHAQSDPPL